MQRQKSASKPQDGEKRRRRRSEDEGRSVAFSPDARLCVSLLCLSLCLFITWLHVQQSATLAEISQKYERLRGLEETLSAVSLELQASSSSVSSALQSWAALRAEQEASELLLRSLAERARSLTEAQRSPEPEELRRRSRAAHGSVAQQLNDAEALLQALSRRLQEVQDGTARNGRALERSEEEDARRLSDRLDWSDDAVSKLLRQLRRLEERGLELRGRLDSRAPVRTHLPAAEDAVRSVLRLGARLSATYGRLEELQERVRSAEEHVSGAQLGD
ncbi:inhibitor of nuclear factor kappa-B kinase-interacting protein isoform X2 [Puntigrus tetrazona]|uniref:inhibitor of nuclear factor kappa-B kinase-interacting protein isoform X2 n=1 Tax=Puntigrus tetrazona TaxID=1606681 RepID=UPI001C88EC8D|nr:inhibitor of nuclear factor kappa-B kinase-interacting protein isoform X2 [Puntigrus tetrazona]